MANVTKQMTISDVLRLDASTADIFMQFGMTCLTCPFSTAESLADASVVHGVDADELVNKLNDHLATKG